MRHELARKDWAAAVRSARAHRQREAHREARFQKIRRYLWFDQDTGLLRYHRRAPGDFPNSPYPEASADRWNSVDAGRPCILSRRGVMAAGGLYRVTETMEALGFPGETPTRLPAPSRLAVPDVARLYGEAYALRIVARRSNRLAIMAKLPKAP